MITRKAILRLMDAGLIRVTPEPVKIGPNSIDLRIGDSLKTYSPEANRVLVEDPVTGQVFAAIDPKNPPPLLEVPKTGDGRWLLVPGRFYLGTTLEETYCKGVVPHLDGRSTCGRLSIEAHKTAGVGDNGFKGQWTLEIEVTEPVLVAPRDRLLQLYFTPAWGSGLAMLLQGAAQEGRPATFHPYDPTTVMYGDDWEGALFELHDLYGTDGGGHHYQGSKDVVGASPLD